MTQQARETAEQLTDPEAKGAVMRLAEHLKRLAHAAAAPTEIPRGEWTDKGIEGNSLLPCFSARCTLLQQVHSAERKNTRKCQASVRQNTGITAGGLGPNLTIEQPISLSTLVCKANARSRAAS